MSNMKSFQVVVLYLCIISVSSDSGDFSSHICVSWLSGSCIGGDRGLTSTTVWLTYYCGENMVEEAKPIIALYKNTTVNLTYALERDNVTTDECGREVYLFEQPEHGGGECNCVDIYFDEYCETNNSITLCGGSASLPRRVEVMRNSSSTTIFESSPMMNIKESHIQLMCNITPYIEVSFLTVFENSDNFNTINEFNEGVEFSLRLSSMPDEWIPLKFIYFRNGSNSSEIFIGDINNFILRGYEVKYVDADSIVEITICLCGFNITDSVQFRWLQTSRFTKSDFIPRDLWILDDIIINFVTETQEEINLLNESFDSLELNPVIWPESHVRNANVTTYGNHTEGLLFGLQNTSGTIIKSRALLTNVYNLSSFCLYSTPVVVTPSLSSKSVSINPSIVNFTAKIQSTSANLNLLSGSPSLTIISETISNMPSTTLQLSGSSFQRISATTTSLTQTTMITSTSPESNGLVTNSEKLSDLEFILEANQNAANMIMSSEKLNKVLNAEVSIGSFSLIQNLTATADYYSLVLAYLYGSVIRRLNNTTFSDSLFEIIIETGGELLQSQHLVGSRSALTVGTSILLSLDTLLFTYVPRSYVFVTSNSALRSQHSCALISKLVNLSDLINMTSITAIDTYDFIGLENPRISLTIPIELLKAFDDGDGLIRIISAVYRNVSWVFFNGISENSTLGPDIVASSIQCGIESCPGSNYILHSVNVTIIFEHPSSIIEKLIIDDLETKCVFLDITQHESTILKIGHWSDRGCTRNTSLSTINRTVCNCNHLTSFAILLSPKPIDFDHPIALSLTIISYIGVSISLVAMVLTILTFVSLKSLHNTRNYIHINLCVSLAIAQIIFVAGADKTGPPNGDVPIYCQVIAVLLHYFFLVSFMWMLMEGVVLYVALVHVFTRNSKRYIYIFTVTSYGLPLLYMALLTLPLGFGLPDKQNYGYNRACFLSPNTNFVWAFIAPFILIFLANIGFFITAARIMWHHQMKQIHKTKLQNVHSWLRSAVSLVVIMSLTWITGVFLITVQKLAPVAYIFTTMVAFQGVFIFLIFVVFSKAVREAYMKWWRIRVSLSDFLSKYFDSHITSSNIVVQSNGQKPISISSKTSKTSNNRKQIKITLTENEDMKKDARGFEKSGSDIPLDTFYQNDSSSKSDLLPTTSFNSSDKNAKLVTEYSKHS